MGNEDALEFRDPMEKGSVRARQEFQCRSLPIEDACIQEKRRSALQRRHAPVGAGSDKWLPRRTFEARVHELERIQQDSAPGTYGKRGCKLEMKGFL